MMNKIISATRTLPGFVLTVVAGMLYVSAVTAAPVTVDFTKNDATGSGSLSGAGPNVSRFLVYDSDGANASGGNPGSGLYIFSGALYEYSVQIDNFGTLSGLSVITQVGDDGAVIPGQDTFQVVGDDVQYQVSIVWNGPTSSFTGNDIPDLSVLGDMSAQLNIFNKSTLEFEV